MLPKKNTTIVFFLIFVIALWLRFYNLLWGNGIFPHPDENNIASLAATTTSISQGTFAYGNFLTNLTHALLTSLGRNTFFAQILTLRLISAISAVATIPIVYVLGKRLGSTVVGLTSSALVAFSPGLIQAAHFGTFESYLIALQALIFFLSLSILKKLSIWKVLVTGIILSLTVAVKINSVVFAALPAIAILSHLKFPRIRFKNILWITALIVILIALAGVLTVFFSPYYLTREFTGLFRYERQLVTGALDVFYTRQFLGTTPLFSLNNILPWVTNPFFLILLPLSFIFTTLKSLKADRGQKIILLSYFLLTFIPPTLVFAKWTRYLLPAIVPSALLVSYFLMNIGKPMSKLLALVVVGVSLIQGLGFFSMYTRPDTRVTSSSWINDNIPSGEFLLSETANVIDIPLAVSLNRSKHELPVFHLVGFDFYNLDANPKLMAELTQSLVKANYIIIPSRRIFKNIVRLPDQYPRVARYYQLLFSGGLGFEQVMEFHSFPCLGYPIPVCLPVNDEDAEETWTVFDHPVVRIYKKIKPLTRAEYQLLLGIDSDIK